MVLLSVSCIVKFNLITWEKAPEKLVSLEKNLIRKETVWPQATVDQSGDNPISAFVPCFKVNKGGNLAVSHDTAHLTQLI